jgi:peptide-methionine (S)-S-oxide reductase
MFFMRKNAVMPAKTDALPGRPDAIPTAPTHFVFGTPLKGPFPENTREIIFGLGCFWGAERVFWQHSGVISTAVGYAAGYTPNPSYQEVCSGMTGHNEVVRVIYDPERTSLDALLKLFWESHDPTQGMRQGNDVGTQYRSGIYLADPEDRTRAEASKQAYQTALGGRRYGPITTEILPAPEFFYAEDYHQQYLAKNPNGYCGLGGTGIACPAPQASTAAE